MFIHISQRYAPCLNYAPCLIILTISPRKCYHVLYYVLCNGPLIGCVYLSHFFNCLVHRVIVCVPRKYTSDTVGFERGTPTPVL